MYLYAITDRPIGRVPDRPGLGDTTVCVLTYQDIAAVVSPLSTAEVRPTPPNLWRHEAVVESLMADGAVLPVRFGTWLTSEPAVQSILTVHYADFVTALARVRGRVELGLRVLWDERDGESRRPGAIGDGRTYLLARLEEERRHRARREQAEAWASTLHSPLASLASESTRKVLITPRLLLTAAYLVEQGQVAAFRQAVDALRASHTTWHFLCTGPWPPYSFVTATVSTPRHTVDIGWRN